MSAGFKCDSPGDNTVLFVEIAVICYANDVDFLKKTILLEKPMATKKEALEVLKRVTSDDTVEVMHLEDGVTVIKVIPQKEKAEEQNKWVHFADDMHEESPLKGQSELVNARIREFRGDFSFEGE